MRNVLSKGYAIVYVTRPVLFKGKYLRKYVDFCAIMQVYIKDVHSKHASFFNGCNIPPGQCFMYKTHRPNMKHGLNQCNVKFKNAGNIQQIFCLYLKYSFERYSCQLKMCSVWDTQFSFERCGVFQRNSTCSKYQVFPAKKTWNSFWHIVCYSVDNCNA